jgi:hypothetical protein
MLEKTRSYNAFYLPGPEDLPTYQALTLGLQWLRRQPGRPLVVLQTMSVLKNNHLLAEAVQQFGATVMASPQLGDTDWSGGSILFWASERELEVMDEKLTDVDAVCVIASSSRDTPRAKAALDTWIARHQATDLRNPEEPAQTARRQLGPVVEIAMAHASRAINHDNALVTPEDKAYVVRTLQELVRSGHAYEVEGLVAWAINDGWYPAEIPRLRDYARRVLNGRRFQLGTPRGPEKGASKRWVDEVAERHHEATNDLASGRLSRHPSPQAASPCHASAPSEDLGRPADRLNALPPLNLRHGVAPSTATTASGRSRQKRRC